jgi:lipopolysaccharide biosynthesis protein
MRRVTPAAVRRRLSKVKAEALNDIGDIRVRWQRRGPRSAVDYRDFLERRMGRAVGGFPDIWRTRKDLRSAGPAKVAVLIHVFYPELLPELLDQLESVPVGYDLIITNASRQPISVSRIDAPGALHVVVLDVENHGRDIWPMVQVVNAGLLDPYEIVLKVHTKRSEWRAEHPDLAGSGEQWRGELVASLLGDRENVSGILSAFADNPDVGVVGAPGNLLGPEFWGGDLALVQELLRRLELRVEPDSLLFPAGSFYWIRAFVLQGLRALALTAQDFEKEAGQIDATTAHAIERSIGLLTSEAGLKMVTSADIVDTQSETWRRFAQDASRRPRARILPFYLPQFHPTPENNMWWGEGFTEWTNVTAARPIFEGHNQPNLPADLGFYDLRLDEVRAAQMELAAGHGIEGFMYYYYWFAGHRLLSTPVDALLASDVQKPFCLMWANENWTRRWDGRSSDILMGQDYEHVPASEFIDDVMKFLADPRYLRVDGRPVLAVYRISQIPNHQQVMEQWRQRARESGVGELFLLSVDVARQFDGLIGGAKAAGLDGLLGFPPHNLKWEWVSHSGLSVDRRFKGNLLSYEAMARDAERRMARLDDTMFPGVMVNFDNTARRQFASDVWFGSNPYTFRRWLAASVSGVSHREPDERIVFVNAWNEWAEAAILEPTMRFGRTFLLAVRDVVHG